MKKLSEIIKTDCYIDCGSNDTLREVYPLINMKETFTQRYFGVGMSDSIIRISFSAGIKRTALGGNMQDPIHHISEIDLNS